MFYMPRKRVCQAARGLSTRRSPNPKIKLLCIVRVAKNKITRLFFPSLFPLFAIFHLFYKLCIIHNTYIYIAKFLEYMCKRKVCRITPLELFPSRFVVTISTRQIFSRAGILTSDADERMKF